jgi:hypothetical protein
MNYKLAASLVFSGVLASSAMVRAQQDTAPPSSQDSSQSTAQMQNGGLGRSGGPAMMDPNKRLAHMTKRYNLTSDQQNQILPILQNEQQQSQALRGDTTLSRQDKHAKMMSLHQDTTQKIEAVMNDDQKQKFEADQQRMQQMRAQRMQQGAPSSGNAPAGGSSAPAPPQQ